MAQRIFICRLCREQTPDSSTFSVFESNIAEMISSLTPLEVSDDVKHSPRICTNCYKDLKTAYSIQQRFCKIEQKHEYQLTANYLIENHDELVKVIQHELIKLESGENLRRISDKLSKMVQQSAIKYSCKMCSEIFELSPEFLRHLQQHISEIPAKPSKFPCEQCEWVFSTNQEYNAHQHFTHPKVSSKCKICLKEFPTLDDFKEHARQKHSERKPFLCDICFQVFLDIDNYHRHKDKHKNPYVNFCRICDLDLVYDIAYSYHVRAIHEGPPDPKFTEHLRLPRTPRSILKKVNC